MALGCRRRTLKTPLIISQLSYDPTENTLFGNWWILLIIAIEALRTRSEKHCRNTQMYVYASVLFY